MDTKKKYKGVVTPPIFGAGERGALLGSRARLRKGTMVPPKPEPRYQLMMKTMKVEPSKPRYGAGGTDNPKQTAKKKTVAKKKPVAKKKTEAQKRYEEQIKARRKRQKKDPLGRD